jgi:hypothetical protein
MSNADSEEVSVVVERGGISVEKSFEPDDFPVPAIAFVIHADRDETTDIRIVDQVPDDVPAQDIGFHPKYGADFWTVEDDEIVFEREFETGEEYTTVYGLRAKDTDDVQRFLTEPAIEGVEGEETVGDIIGDEPESDADGASENGEEEDEPADTSIELDDPTGVDLGTDDEAADEDEAEPDPAEASADDLESAIADVDGTEAEAEESEVDEESAAPGPAEPADDDPTAAVRTATDGVAAHDAGGAVTPEDLAAALAAEVRAGEVADEDLDTLRDALGVDAGASGEGVPGHVEAKLDKLQGDVDEALAYAGALESFLDDAGTADDLLEMRDEFDELLAMQEEFDDLRDGLADVEESVAGMEDQVDGVEDRVGEVAATTDSLEGSVEELRADLAELEDGLGENLNDRVTDIEDELDEMENDIQTLENLRQALTGD